MIVAGLRWRGPQGIRAISHIAALQIRRELALPDGHCLEDLLVHWSIRPIEGPMLVLDRVSWLLQRPWDRFRTRSRSHVLHQWNSWWGDFLAFLSQATPEQKRSCSSYVFNQATGMQYLGFSEPTPLHQNAMLGQGFLCKKSLAFSFKSCGSKGFVIKSLDPLSKPLTWSQWNPTGEFQGRVEHPEQGLLRCSKSSTWTLLRRNHEIPWSSHHSGLKSCHCGWRLVIHQDNWQVRDGSILLPDASNHAGKLSQSAWKQYSHWSWHRNLSWQEWTISTPWWLLLASKKLLQTCKPKHLRLRDKMPSFQVGSPRLQMPSTDSVLAS